MSIEKDTLPKRFTQGDFEYEKKKATTPIYFVYPEYVEELRKYKIPIAPDMQDKELTNFISRIQDTESIDKKIPTIIRLKHINREGPNKGKKAEYMAWYETWNAVDKNGHVIPEVSDLPRGYDKGIDVSRSTDSDGTDNYKVEREYWKYNVPFSAEKLDEILQETNTDADSVQYIVNGIRPWSGFSYDEFRNLSFSELEERGRTGKVQQPVVIENKVNKTVATKTK